MKSCKHERIIDGDRVCMNPEFKYNACCNEYIRQICRYREEDAE